ncbi:serpin family protein [Candidatus Dependentiae bacterium]|nr:serpin family protein [Candidatus Dependentiae bacterium]
MKMTNKFGWIILFLVCINSICFSVNEEKDFSTQTEQIKKYNEFSVELFKVIYKSNPKKNIFISPLGILTNLAIIYNGASPEAQEEIANKILSENISDEQFNQMNLDIHKSLEKTHKKIKFHIYNSLIVDRNFKLYDDFKNICIKYYLTELEYADFNNPAEIVNKINQQVKERTNNKIKNVIDPDSINPNTFAILLNTIYFRAEWEKKFNILRTKKHKFYMDNKTIRHPFMSKKTGHYISGNKKMTILKLPYKGNRYSMYLFLNREEKSNLETFIQNFSFNDFEELLKDMGASEIKIYVPRFKIEDETDLKLFLPKLGINKIFQANEIPLSKTANILSLWIDEFKQNTFIAVNERETEVATATQCLYTLGTCFYVLKFNRPFMFLIRDDKTGLILFMGTVYRPIDPGGAGNSQKYLVILLILISLIVVFLIIYDIDLFKYYNLIPTFNYKYKKFNNLIWMNKLDEAYMLGKKLQKSIKHRKGEESKEFIEICIMMSLISKLSENYDDMNIFKRKFDDLITSDKIKDKIKRNLLNLSEQIKKINKISDYQKSLSNYKLPIKRKIKIINTIKSFFTIILISLITYPSFIILILIYRSLFNIITVQILAIIFYLNSLFLFYPILKGKWWNRIPAILIYLFNIILLIISLTILQDWM